MIKRKDLADISDKNYDSRRSEFMQCLDCGEEFGGTQGDYWSIQMDYVLYCPECNGENIALVKKVCQNVIIKQ